MRVLVAFEDDYRTYREMIAASIEIQRPQVEVVSTEINKLEMEAKHFKPHLFICSQPRIDKPNGGWGWIQLSPHPQQCTRIWIGERYQEASNPGIATLISVVDEVGDLVVSQGS